LRETKDNLNLISWWLESWGQLQTQNSGRESSGSHN
jgi:hypothetical protein